MTHELGGLGISPSVRSPNSATQRYHEQRHGLVSTPMSACHDETQTPRSGGSAKAVGSNALGCRRALVMQARKVPRSLTSKRLSDLTLAPLLSMLRCVWLFGDHRGPPTCRDNS
jgi:hypothetical protein